MSNDNSRSEDLNISDETLYQETAKIAAIFWEWRHKTMTRFFAGVGGVIGIMVWLYENGGRLIRWWHAIPLGIGALYSVICYYLDKRHTTIFVECYDIASKLELKSRDHGIYTFIKRLHQKRGSLTQILHFIYLGCAGVLFVLSIITFVKGHP